MFRMKPTRAAIRCGTLIAVLALMLLAGGGFASPPASAQTASLRIDPANQTIAAGQSFTISIIQSADFASLGAAATLQFDPNVVQVVGVEVGPPYADGLFLFGGGATGAGAQTPEQAIADANVTGLLPNITTFFLPGAGSIPPGDAVVATISMSGRGAGTSPLNLVTYAGTDISTGANTLGLAADPPDPQGNLIPVTVSPGQVTVPGGPAPPPRAVTPTVAAAAATPETSATPSPAAATPNPNASATLTVSAGSQQLAVGGEAKVELKLKANVETSEAETGLVFDKSVIEITKVEKGADWKNATLSIGSGSQKIEQAIADANSKGELKGANVALISTGGTAASRSSASPTPAGVAAGQAGGAASSPEASSPSPAALGAASTPGASSPTPSSSRTKTPSVTEAASSGDTFLVLTVKGLKNGETELKVKSPVVQDQSGKPIKVTSQNAKLVVGEGGGGGGGLSLLLIIAGGLVVLAIVGGIGFAARSLSRRNV